MGRTCLTFDFRRGRLNAISVPMLSACPHLPAARPGLDWRTLHAHRAAPRGAVFYFACLEYAQALWTRGLAARAILCLDRALGARLRGDEPVLAAWPLPYAALDWILRQSAPEGLVGNPRIHFQHYAGRMNAPRREQRRWRAWACWALARAAHPGLAGDPRHRIKEPTRTQIARRLARHGLPGEEALWRQVLAPGRAARAEKRTAPPSRLRRSVPRYAADRSAG